MKFKYLRIYVDGKELKSKKYLISRDGKRLKNRITKKHLKIFTHKGYRCVTIRVCGIYFSPIKICILQWCTWKGEISENEVIHHKKWSRDPKKNSRLKLNDHIENLIKKDRLNHDRIHAIGRKLSPETRKKISLSLSGEKHYLYGKHRSDKIKKKISKSRKGKNSGEEHYLYGKHRSNKTKEKISKSLKGKFAGSKNPSSRLNKADVIEIREMSYKLGVSQQEIADRFLVSKGCINGILQGYTWNPNNLSKKELKRHYGNFI